MSTGQSSKHQAAQYEQIDETMKRFNYRRDALMETLMTAQDQFGYLSEAVLTYISNQLHVPLSQVYGVATFYEMFSLEPIGVTKCMVCGDPICASAGADALLEEIQYQTGASKLDQPSPDGHYTVKRVSCLGLCDQAPAALVNDKAQVDLTPADVPAMLQGKASPSRIQVSGDPRILTASIGKLEPTDLDAHCQMGAFTALEKALFDMTPEAIIEEVKKSKLAGRGGAGFPTGLKWELARNSLNLPRYVVCNFDESEPGTFKDRALMEGDPFHVIEGMIINAYAIGAESGYIYIRGEYRAAIDVIEEALNKLYQANLLGDNIMNSGYSLYIETRYNAGAYICGEETALFESIEGKRGHPRMKPPYPTQQGLFGQPTVINNVETLATIPHIVMNGGEWLHQWGTPQSIGLKLFCLSGHVNQPGVVEVPFGLTIRELVEQFGGGFTSSPQAILIGGAAGGFLHPDNFDVRLTHEALRQYNVPLGSGAIMVFNDTVDLWDVLKGLAQFFIHETCGQCAPCRLGTKQIYHLIKQHDQEENISQLWKTGELVKSTCECGLGMTAANPLMTFLEGFGESHQHA